MDVESDDSDRWEDFFGSTTDLAPSLLGFYDTLTTTLDGQSSYSLTLGTKAINADCENYEDPSFLSAESNSPHAELYLNKLQASKRAALKAAYQDAEDVYPRSQTPSNSGSCNNSLKGSLESIFSPNGTLNKHRSNIPILSANVQRIIAHSETKAVDAVNFETSQDIIRDAITQRLFKKPFTPNTNSHKLNHSILPLSKTTGKLTQTGTDLVETLNTRLTEDVDYHRRIDIKAISSKKPPTPTIFLLPGVDDDKTPTNSTSFSFDSINGEKLHSNRQLNLPEICISTDPFGKVVSNMSLQCSPKENMSKSINYEVNTENLKNLSLAGINLPTVIDEQQFVDAINKPLISKYVARSTENRPLTYARSKSMAARDFAKKNIAVKRSMATMSCSMLLPDMEQQDEKQLSGESLDRLAEIKSKFSPKESKRLSGLQIPDIAKLKHRPLSSSSICSTSSSSSSSSGADQASGKLNTSYLASVESLADHSENELIETHIGMTVFERACMEIVDSEKNYVNDLGEVIRGYLLDWKERACLHQNELQVLFSNIEDVYVFNQFLLKHLTDSILDPLKIAKCFIDLKDGFDVYTGYCTSYPGAISLLTKLLQATHTNALLASTQRMLHHTLPLGSYLLKPVQRILKYHLLLDNLRKHCDVKEVMQAYEIMRQVARNIDQVKRKLEQQTRVKELCGILDGWLGPELTVLGELRLEGVLMENNKPRKVLLFATMLIIAKAKEDNRLQFKSYIHQNNLMLSEHLAGEPTSFYVIPYDEPRNQIKLTAKNRDQKRLWTQHIKSVILEKFDNIPLRAKELVYQLGDEEDRTTDKSPWKWGLHSTSTPTYLERRNQFRRSEMRNRSKVKRKTISNVASIDIFNEPMNKDTSSFLRSMSKSAESINDKSLPSPEPSGNDELILGDGICNNVDCIKRQMCSCATFLDAKQNRGSPKLLKAQPKSFRFGGKPLKERSKSVPRISNMVDSLDKTAPEANMEESIRSVEPCRVTIKTFPKRMTSSLKRQKSKAKETSTFYMNLSEFEDSNSTVLKITESSENILNTSKNEVIIGSNEHIQLPDVIQKSEVLATYNEMSKTLSLTPSEKAKQDAQIILDLLKNSKEFDKLCSMLQKKRTIDKNCHSTKASELHMLKDKAESPPRPPSRSPPPLDTGTDCSKLTPILHGYEEPIYETLLRNVHVPYKFSPVLGRSKSVQYSKCSEEKNAASRPESDYVTLVYTAKGVLTNVDNEEVSRTPIMVQDVNETSSATLVGYSYDNENLTDHNPENMTQHMSASFHGTSEYSQTRSNSTKSLLKRLWSHTTLTVEEPVSTALCPLSINQDRRGSENFEKERNSILHLQGCETIGERMAHVDYADPRTLFPINKRDVHNQLQRDSVFSLTSSNDSGCESKSVETSHLLNPVKFNYEDSVEACLEYDFRDSAIYSDDNERRQDKNFTLPLKTSGNPPLKPKPLHVPPLLRIKPFFNRTTSIQDQPIPVDSQLVPGVIMCPPDMSPSTTRSWVLQQIDNFSK